MPVCKINVLISLVIKFLLITKSLVEISSFPGCTTSDMFDFVKPILRRKPNRLIIHVGANSLRDAASPRACAEKIVDLAREIESTAPDTELVLSTLVARSDDEELAKQVTETNSVLTRFCRQNEWKIIDNSNISADLHLNLSGLHLNKKGTSLLASNYLNYMYSKH